MKVVEMYQTVYMVDGMLNDLDNIDDLTEYKKFNENFLLFFP